MKKFRYTATALSIILALSLTGCGKSKDSSSSSSNGSSSTTTISTGTNAEGEFASIAGTWEDDVNNKVIIRPDGKYIKFSGNDDIIEEGICAFDEKDNTLVNFGYPNGEYLYSAKTDGSDNVSSFENNKTGKTYNKTTAANYSLDLPEYKYNGDDKYISAITEYCLKETAGTMENDVFIPAPVIFKTDESDSNDIKITGVFWVMGYDIYDNILYGGASTQMPGILHLKQKGSSYEVVSAEIARDGADYDTDIKKFCNGDTELEDKFTNNLDYLEEARKAEVKSYVDTNGLNIIGYQDFGWTLVELN